MADGSRQRQLARTDGSCGGCVCKCDSYLQLRELTHIYFQNILQVSVLSGSRSGSGFCQVPPGSDTMEDEVESATAPTVMLRSATLMQGDNDNYLKIYPLRKGMRERQKVMRASRDPRVYILTPLYQMKGTPPAGHDVSKAGKGGKKEEGTGGDNDDKTGANNEDKTGGGNEEKREETSKKVKQKTKKKEKKSNFQEEDACERIIIPTLDRSAQVRKGIIMKLCTLLSNRFYCKGML